METREQEVNRPKHHQQFIEAQHNCALCGTRVRLEITKQDQRVKEEAFCPSCGVKTRNKDHYLN